MDEQGKTFLNDAANDPPRRVGYDSFIQENCCPCCGHILQSVAEEIRNCPECRQRLLWY